uniref:Uncharacterized protein n=1 Tax=Chenopodium quinoa TaxID=63459 RepID=A0A803MCN9_CHEQI
MSKTKLIVMVPTPAMGHLPSTVEFAKLLVQRDQHISILLVILHSPFIITSKAIDAYIESQSLETDPNRITFYTFPPVVVPNNDPPSPNFLSTIIELQKPLVKKAVEDQGTKPAAFVLDMMYVSMMDVASELDVPSYVYFTSGANLLSVFLHAQSLYDYEGVDIIFTEFVDPMPKQEQDPVGPILSLDGRSQHEVQDQDLVMEWLDEQPLSSVVFLCFGSMGGFDVDQVTEIANGLDRSGFRFLWSLIEALPEGFVDRMAHRGKIIKWAPQVQILAHRAIGGFVTHCGWNSILESLWFGVTMATWPMCADQQLNAFELVKELGLAVEISINYRLNFMIGKGNYLVTAEEVENEVKRLMNMDEEIIERVREISDFSRKALKDGGSSNYELIRFVEDVLHN